ncbi:hypothetical protein Tco_1388521, partial [Tanacetum coccineum]
MVTTGGIKADPEKIRALINRPSLSKPEQIRTLCLKLTDLEQFLP